MRSDDPVSQQPQPTISSSEDDLARIEGDSGTESSYPIQQNPTLTPRDNRSGLAITAFILSILGFLTGFLIIGIFLGLIGLILGIVSLAKKRGGKGFAIASIVMGGITLLFTPIILAIIFTSYQGVQQRAKDAQTHAESKYNSQNNTFNDSHSQE